MYYHYTKVTFWCSELYPLFGGVLYSEVPLYTYPYTSLFIQKTTKRYLNGLLMTIPQVVLSEGFGQLDDSFSKSFIQKAAKQGVFKT